MWAQQLLIPWRISRGMNSGYKSSWFSVFFQCWGRALDIPALTPGGSVLLILSGAVQILRGVAGRYANSEEAVSYMSVTYKDYYKILGIEKNADKDEISRAYRKLARKYHPDLNPGNAQAEEKFKDVTEAYEVLKDDEKRKLYDQLGPDWQQSGAFSGRNPFEGRGSYTFDRQAFDGSQFSDFFETLFGNGRGGFRGDPFADLRTRHQAGRDMEVEVQITLEDAVHGNTRSISLHTGEGMKNFTVAIPAGVADGARLRLAGQGYAAPSGGPRGDLYLRIRFGRHPLFQVDGKDITYEAELTPWQAVLGAKIVIPTLDGSVELTIPAGTSSGRRMRLRGRGLGPATARGDLYVRIGIRVPSHLTDRQRELWKALAAESGK